jgi:hypothetical protein
VGDAGDAADAADAVAAWPDRKLDLIFERSNALRSAEFVPEGERHPGTPEATGVGRIVDPARPVR